MNSSEENGGSNKDRRTKTQLLQELAEMNKSLEQSQSELSSRSKELLDAKVRIKELQRGEVKSASMEREMERFQLNLNKMTEDLTRIKEAIERLKSQNEKTKTESEELKLQLTNCQEQITRYEEQAIEQQKAAKNQKENFETQIQQLQEQIDELSKKIADEMVESNEQDYVAAPTARFRIEITPSDDNYRTVIDHPLSKDIKVIKGIDMEMILKFITKHLPKLEEPNGELEILPLPPISEEVKKETINVTEVKNDMNQLPRFKTIKKTGILKEIRIKQSDFLLENGQNINSNCDFAVLARLQLPIAPSSQNIDIDTTCYNIRAVVKEINENKLIFEKDIADDLSFGIVDYEKAVTISRLTPGKYLIFINAIVPFIPISDQKIIEIEVKD